MKITTVIENLQDDDRKLCHEHGLSLHIQKGSTSLLFDTGASGAFLKNARELGIDVRGVEFVVLSHGHHDHSGGLPAFFRENTGAPVYMKQEVTSELYSQAVLGLRENGTDRKVFSEFGDRIRFVNGFCQISEGVFVITDIASTYPTPEGNRLLRVKRDGEIVQDDFRHELVLAIEESDGVVLFSGCSHNGVDNMIETVKERFPGKRIKAVIGGFHLIRMAKGKCPEAAGALARKFEEEGIDRIYTAHCTGEEGFAELEAKLGDKIAYLKTGTAIEV